MNRAALILILLLVGCGGSSNSLAPSPVPSPAPTPAPAPQPPPTPFQGVWVGTWTKQQCTENGSGAAGACAAWPSGGGFSLTLTQNAQAAQGTLTLGAFQLNVSGPIDSGGTLTLSGNGHQASANVNITTWRTSISGNLMLGSFVYAVIPDNAANGTLTVTAGLQSVVRQ